MFPDWKIWTKNSRHMDSNFMNDDSFRLSLSNPTNDKQTIGLFDVAQNEATGIIEDGRGIAFTATQGVENGVNLPALNGGGDFAWDTQRNIIYEPVQFEGIWVYDIDTKTGSLITTGTAVNGDALQSDNVTDVAIDMENNVIYVATTSGVWEYDVENNVGKVYNELGGVATGDQLPKNFNFKLTYDSNNHFVWVGGSGTGAHHVWRLDIASSDGLTVSAPANGDIYNTNANTKGILIDTANNKLYVSTDLYGLWQYDPVTDTGKVFNTGGGAANGDQMPHNNTGRQIGLKGNIVYVPTDLGVWVYDSSTDTGSIINDATVVDGDSLPVNAIASCYYDAENNRLYVGMTTHLWYLDLDTNEGFARTDGTPVNSGDKHVGGTVIKIEYFNGVLWVGTSFDGVWQYIEFSESSAIVINNDSDSGQAGSYGFILEQIKTRPIAVSKIIYQCDNEEQKSNALKIIENSVDGTGSSEFVNIIKHISPEYPYHTIHIDLEKEIILNHDSFISLDVEALTDVNLIFIGRQVTMSDLTEPEEVKTPTPISSPVVATTNETEKGKSVFSIILLLIAGYLTYKHFKNE